MKLHGYSFFWVLIGILAVSAWCCDMSMALDLPASMKILPDEHMLVQSLGNEPGLYDETILRTINIEFPDSLWENQEAFWKMMYHNHFSQIDISGNIEVDNDMFENVGIRIKGNSSLYYAYGLRTYKFSLNVSMDYENTEQRIMNYKTLNLNNCYMDPSMMREVLYNRMCRAYIPSPQAGFVKVLINGENWGIYDNVQQVNSDFIDEWFLSNDGDRWKADSSGSGFGDGESALRWLGNTESEYENAYELKSEKTDDPWCKLITVCDILSNTPLSALADTLDMVLNVDRCLWALVLENVFTDSDGYMIKGSDYCLYYDTETGRINMIQYDGNETFSSNPSIKTQSPFINESETALPLVHRLFAVPRLRQRYIAHMRTIIDESLDWEILEPIVEEYRELIEEYVRLDGKDIVYDESFDESLQGLENFVTVRRNYLLDKAELKRQALTIGEVSCSAFSDKKPLYHVGEPAQVTAEIDGSNPVSEVFLYYGGGIAGRFDYTAMYDDGSHGDGAAGDRVFGADIPPFDPGSPVRFYIEAVADDNVGTASYKPAGAEHDVYFYLTPIPLAESSPVVINELMASNTATTADPQGDYDDWIELANLSDETVDLTGHYLSDKLDNPMKWQFPDGTTIDSGEYLIVWADEDGKDTPGLHANFKLSADGEAVLLIDTDEHGNAILDSLSFGVQTTDMAYGRYPDCTGTFAMLSAATPGNANAPVGIEQDAVPCSFALMQNYPNPFNNHTVISFTLSEPGDVELTIYNLAGQKITTLADGLFPVGPGQAVWDGCDSHGREAASGVYVYRLKMGSLVQARQLLLVR